jgi:O-antigen ligase
LKRQVLASSLFVVLIGFALGAQIGEGTGVKLLIGLSVVLLGLVVSRVSPAVMVGLGIGWLPVAGDLSIIRLGALPDVTVERLGVVLICLASAASFAKRGLSAARDGRLRLSLNLWLPALGLILLSALGAHSVSTALRLVMDSYVLPTLAVVALSAVPWTESDVSRATLAAASGAAAWAVLGVVEVLTGRSLYTDSGVPFAAYANYIRPGGPFVNPAGLGLAIGCLAVLCLAWILGHSQGRAALITVVGILLLALILTLTRSAWLGFTVGALVVLGWMAPRSRLSALSVAGFVAVVSVAVVDYVGQGTVFGRLFDEGTALGRAVMYVTAVNMSLRSPLTGLGVGGFGALVSSSLAGIGGVPAASGSGVFVPHNSILLVAVESGWPAALGLVVALGLLLAFALSRAAESRDWVNVGAVGIIACYAVNAMLFDVQLMTHSGVILAMLLGILIGHLGHRDLLGTPQESA